jgi:transposase
MNSETKQYVGIDLSKAECVCRTPERAMSVPNERKAVSQQLQAWREKYPRLHLIVEPSGGCERLLLAVAAEQQIPVSRVNARQVRDYARGLGWLEKSDAIDALLLQRYGEQAQPAATPPAPKVEETLRELVQLRDHYVEQLQHEQTYAASLQHPAAIKLVAQRCRQIETTIAKVERQIEALIETEAPELETRVQTLCLVSGVGIRSAISLLAYLPELGRLTDGQISKLTGVAPIVDDSGLRHGNRHIKYGRAQPRRILYMCACVAAQHNEYLQPFYARLIARGKPFKVAIIAVARKLLSFLNQLLKPLPQATT